MMRIFRHIESVPASLKGAVVAIGNFDGVHLGHRALLEEAARLAEERGAPMTALVFEPTPQEFFRPGAAPFRLTPFRAKAGLIAALGADALFAFPFNADLAHKGAQDFVLDILVQGLEAGCVVVGRDFKFGKGRGGNATVLAYMGEMEGFGVTIVPPVMANADEKISSTLIRQALRAGRPEEAARLLGRPFAIEGRIEHGEARGRTLGFPTANVAMTGYIRPAFGIYAVRAVVMDGETAVSRHDGVANVGIRPMYRAEEPLLEAFLFDFAGDIYGKHISVELVAYLRPEAKFSGVDELITQMNRDKADAKSALDRIPSR